MGQARKNAKPLPATELFERHGIPAFNGRIHPQRHGIGLLVDCETTGGSAERNALVEVAFLTFVVEHHGHQRAEILGALDAYTGLCDPGRAEINPIAMRINRLQVDDLRGRSLDQKRILKLVSRADHVVAHNASFDRRFLVPAFPLLSQLPWYCSLRDVAWAACGQPSGKLRLLCEAYGVKPPTHRAMEDVRATLELLSARILGARTAYEHLLFGPTGELEPEPARRAV